MRGVADERDPALGPDGDVRQVLEGDAGMNVSGVTWSRMVSAALSSSAKSLRIKAIHCSKVVSRSCSRVKVLNGRFANQPVREPSETCPKKALRPKTMWKDPVVSAAPSGSSTLKPPKPMSPV